MFRTGTKVDCIVYLSACSRVESEKIASKGFIVLSDSAGHIEFQKNVSINQTHGRGLICIFSKWPPVKPIMYY